MNTRSLVSFLAAFCAAGSLWAAGGSWTNTANGLWSDVNNWDAATPAAGSGAIAWFTNAAPGAITVSNDNASLALLGVTLGGSGFTLAGNTLTLDTTGFIQTLAGDHTVALPLSLSSNTMVTAVTNRALTLGGAISGNGGLTLNGGRVVLANANSYSGQTVLQTGLLEVASMSALGSGSAPVLLGKGTFRFTGTAADTLARGYTLKSGGASTSHTVLDIRTNLTVSGIVSVDATQGGRIIKLGPGTLTYAYPGSQVMNRNTGGYLGDQAITFDTINGGAGSQGYYDFTIAEGKVVFNTVGQTNRIYGGPVIGTRYPAVAHMEVGAGVIQAPDSWFSISRGNGDTTTLLSPSLTVTGGRVEMWGLIMGNGANMPSFRSFPRLIQTGGAITIANDSYVPESGGASATLNFSGGTLTADGLGQGFDLARNGTAGTMMNVSESAVVSLAKLRVNTGGTLSVTNGGTLALRSTTASSAGTVIFDNATLTTYAPLSQPCDWFNALSTFKIRAGGMTANVPSGQYAFLATPPVADPASLGGKITKTGTGTLALYNAEMPIDVNAGRLRMMGGNLTTNKTPKNVNVAANAELELAVPHAAEADTLALTGTTKFELTVPNLAARTELWQANGVAIKRTDGALVLAPASGAGAGSVFMTRPVSVTNAWRADFSVAAVAGRAYGYQGDGVAFVIQNDARGMLAVSTNVTGFGYAGAALPVTNSFAVALDLTNRQLKFGTNGVFVAPSYDIAFLVGLGADMDKTYLSVTYDGTGTVTCTLTRKGVQSNPYTFAANLQALTGTTQAYAGFTAGNTSARNEQHMVRDIAFTTSASAKSYGQYGGKVTLGSGQVLNVALNPATTQNGFGLGQLTYANNSVIDIRQPNLAPAATPTLADKGMWKLNQYANWKTDGRLAVSTNRNDSPGSAFTTNVYPVTGSWTARFGYDIGLTSTPPADYITFTVQNSTPSSTSHAPNPGFAIMWRYYENGTNSTSLRMYTNGVAVLSSMNIAPVSLINGQHANMTVDYNADTKTVKVITSQPAGAFTNIFTGVDLAAAVKSQNAYLGFGAFTGGLNAENIVSDFSFTTSGGVLDTSWQRGYLAFGSASGSGTLVKRGSAALGVQDGPNNPFTNATVRLDEGGLVLRKQVCEPVTLGDDFYLSPVATWAPGGALQVMPAYAVQKGNAVTAVRHLVTNAWTARYTFFMGARTTAPAEGFSFFIHNDPRGPSALGGAYGDAGYSGIAKSVALGWYFYPNYLLSNSVVLGVNGSWSESTRKSHLPVRLDTQGAETDMVIRHDPAAKTLALTMSQGTNVYSTTFTGVDIPASVGGDLAYIGFGAGGGGAYCEARVKDMRFTLDTPTNPLPVLACLGTALLSAGSTNIVTLDTVVPNAGFAIASAQLDSGATLGLESVNANGGTLTLAAASLAGAGAFDVRSGTTLVVSNLTGGTAFTKIGSGTLTLKGTAATYTGNTVLSAGTLSTDAARLPIATDLYVTNSPTLNLAFTGKQYIHSLFVNGAPMPGGQYDAVKVPWISGSGILVVTYPPVGTLFFVR
jgi:autotransporter-associated beta strand protein